MRLLFASVALTLSLNACSSRGDEVHGTDDDTGGSSSGGSSNGGSSNGGSSNGGSSNGGTSTGGASTGGTGGTGACVENLGCELAAPPSTGDAQQDCVNRINQFRAECACLPPLERWTEGEACADQMAEYDSTRMPHDGFRDEICNGGFGQNECPGWMSEGDVIGRCLQDMWGEGPPPGSSCDDECFEDHGHFLNMTSTDFSRVACGFFTSPRGQVWAVQNFAR